MDISIVTDLKGMVDNHNGLAKIFRRVRDYIQDNEGAVLKLRLFRCRGRDPRTYNLPTSDEIAAFVVGDLEDEDFGRDIIVKHMDGSLERLPVTHAAFIP